MALYTAEGIVLRTRNLGEADRIITLYTRERGKVEGVARGSRRSRSRLIGGTQLFTHGRYMLFSGRSLDTLSQAEIRQSFAGLREDLVKMAYASYMAELMDTLVEPGEPSEDLFCLLRDALANLERGGDAAHVARWYELRLMAILGYEPELSACLGCGRGELDGVRFSAREGGLLCPDCAGRDGSAVPIGRSAIEVMRRLVATDGERLGILRPSKADLELIEHIGRAFIDARLPRPLKSLGFLTSVRHLA